MRLSERLIAPLTVFCHAHSLRHTSLICAGLRHVRWADSFATSLQVQGACAITPGLVALWCHGRSATMASPVADKGAMEHIRRSLRQRALRTRGRPNEARSDSSDMSSFSDSDGDDVHYDKSHIQASREGDASRSDRTASISAGNASLAAPLQALADLISGLGVWSRLAAAKGQMVDVPGRSAVAQAAARETTRRALLVGQQGYITANCDSEGILAPNISYGTGLLTDVDAVAIVEQLRSHQRQAATPTSQYEPNPKAAAGLEQIDDEDMDVDDEASIVGSEDDLTGLGSRPTALGHASQLFATDSATMKLVFTAVAARIDPCLRLLDLAARDSNASDCELSLRAAMALQGRSKKPAIDETEQAPPEVAPARVSTTSSPGRARAQPSLTISVTQNLPFAGSSQPKPGQGTTCALWAASLACSDVLEALPVAISQMHGCEEAGAGASAGTGTKGGRPTAAAAAVLAARGLAGRAVSRVGPSIWSVALTSKRGARAAAAEAPAGFSAACAVTGLLRQGLHALGAGRSSAAEAAAPASLEPSRLRGSSEGTHGASLASGAAEAMTRDCTLSSALHSAVMAGRATVLQGADGLPGFGDGDYADRMSVGTANDSMLGDGGRVDMVGLHVVRGLETPNLLSPNAGALGSARQNSRPDLAPASARSATMTANTTATGTAGVAPRVRGAGGVSSRRRRSSALSALTAAGHPGGGRSGPSVDGSGSAARGRATQKQAPAEAVGLARLSTIVSDAQSLFQQQAARIQGEATGWEHARHRQSDAPVVSVLIGGDGGVASSGKAASTLLSAALASLAPPSSATGGVSLTRLGVFDTLLPFLVAVPHKASSGGRERPSQQPAAPASSRARAFTGQTPSPTLGRDRPLSGTGTATHGAASVGGSWLMGLEAVFAAVTDLADGCSPASGDVVMPLRDRTGRMAHSGGTAGGLTAPKPPTASTASLLTQRRRASFRVGGRPAAYSGIPVAAVHDGRGLHQGFGSMRVAPAGAASVAATDRMGVAAGVSKSFCLRQATQAGHSDPSGRYSGSATSQGLARLGCIRFSVAAPRLQCLQLPPLDSADGASAGDGCVKHPAVLQLLADAAAAAAEAQRGPGSAGQGGNVPLTVSRRLLGLGLTPSHAGGFGSSPAVASARPRATTGPVSGARLLLHAPTSTCRRVALQLLGEVVPGAAGGAGAEVPEPSSWSRSSDASSGVNEGGDGDGGGGRRALLVSRPRPECHSALRALQRLKQVLDGLGCGEATLGAVIDGLAAVLHLGNVTDLRDGTSDPHLRQAAALLGLDAGKLWAEVALVSARLSRTEVARVPVPVPTRWCRINALMRTLYGRVVGTLLSAINGAILAALTGAALSSALPAAQAFTDVSDVAGEPGLVPVPDSCLPQGSERCGVLRIVVLGQDVQRRDRTGASPAGVGASAADAIASEYWHSWVQALAAAGPMALRAVAEEPGDEDDQLLRLRPETKPSVAGTAPFAQPTLAQAAAVAVKAVVRGVLERQRAGNPGLARPLGVADSRLVLIAEGIHRRLVTARLATRGGPTSAASLAAELQEQWTEAQQGWSMLSRAAWDRSPRVGAALPQLGRLEEPQDRSGSTTSLRLSLGTRGNRRRQSQDTPAASLADVSRRGHVAAMLSKLQGRASSGKAEDAEDTAAAAVRTQGKPVPAPAESGPFEDEDDATEMGSALVERGAALRAGGALAVDGYMRRLAALVASSTSCSMVLCSDSLGQRGSSCHGSIEAAAAAAIRSGAAQAAAWGFAAGRDGSGQFPALLPLSLHCRLLRPLYSALAVAPWVARAVPGMKDSASRSTASLIASVLAGRVVDVSAGSASARESATADSTSASLNRLASSRHGSGPLGSVLVAPKDVPTLSRSSVQRGLTTATQVLREAVASVPANAWAVQWSRQGSVAALLALAFASGMAAAAATPAALGADAEAYEHLVQTEALTAVESQRAALHLSPVLLPELDQPAVPISLPGNTLVLVPPMLLVQLAGVQRSITRGALVRLQASVRRYLVLLQKRRQDGERSRLWAAIRANTQEALAEAVRVTESRMPTEGLRPQPQYGQAVETLRAMERRVEILGSLARLRGADLTLPQLFNEATETLRGARQAGLAVTEDAIALERARKECEERALAMECLVEGARLAEPGLLRQGLERAVVLERSFPGFARLERARAASVHACVTTEADAVGLAIATLVGVERDILRVLHGAGGVMVMQRAVVAVVRTAKSTILGDPTPANSGRVGTAGEDRSGALGSSPDWSEPNTPASLGSDDGTGSPTPAMALPEEAEAAGEAELDVEAEESGTPAGSALLGLRARSVDAVGEPPTTTSSVRQLGPAAAGDGTKHWNYTRSLGLSVIKVGSEARAAAVLRALNKAKGLGAEGVLARRGWDFDAQALSGKAGATPQRLAAAWVRSSSRAWAASIAVGLEQAVARAVVARLLGGSNGAGLSGPLPSTPLSVTAAPLGHTHAQLQSIRAAVVPSDSVPQGAGRPRHRALSGGSRVPGQVDWAAVLERLQEASGALQRAVAMNKSTAGVGKADAAGESTMAGVSGVPLRPSPMRARQTECEAVDHRSCCFFRATSTLSHSIGVAEGMVSVLSELQQAVLDGKASTALWEIASKLDRAIIATESAANPPACTSVWKAFRASMEDLSSIEDDLATEEDEAQTAATASTMGLSLGDASRVCRWTGLLQDHLCSLSPGSRLNTDLAAIETHPRAVVILFAARAALVAFDRVTSLASSASVPLVRLNVAQGQLDVSVAATKRLWLCLERMGARCDAHLGPPADAEHGQLRAENLDARGVLLVVDAEETARSSQGRRGGQLVDGDGLLGDFDAEVEVEGHGGSAGIDDAEGESDEDDAGEDVAGFGVGEDDVFGDGGASGSSIAAKEGAGHLTAGRATLELESACRGHSVVPGQLAQWSRLLAASATPDAEARQLRHVVAIADAAVVAGCRLLHALLAVRLLERAQRQPESQGSWTQQGGGMDEATLEARLELLREANHALIHSLQHAATELTSPSQSSALPGSVAPGTDKAGGGDGILGALLSVKALVLMASRAATAIATVTANCDTALCVQDAAARQTSAASLIWDDEVGGIVQRRSQQEPGHAALPSAWSGGLEMAADQSLRAMLDCVLGNAAALLAGLRSTSGSFGIDVAQTTPAAVIDAETNPFEAFPAVATSVRVISDLADVRWLVLHDEGAAAPMLPAKHSAVQGAAVAERRSGPRATGPQAGGAGVATGVSSSAESSGHRHLGLREMEQLSVTASRAARSVRRMMTGMGGFEGERRMSVAASAVSPPFTALGGTVATPSRAAAALARLLASLCVPAVEAAAGEAAVARRHILSRRAQELAVEYLWETPISVNGAGQAGCADDLKQLQGRLEAIAAAASATVSGAGEVASPIPVSWEGSESLGQMPPPATQCTGLAAGSGSTALVLDPAARLAGTAALLVGQMRGRMAAGEVVGTTRSALALARLLAAVEANDSGHAEAAGGQASAATAVRPLGKLADALGSLDSAANGLSDGSTGRIILGGSEHAAISAVQRIMPASQHSQRGRRPSNAPPAGVPALLACTAQAVRLASARRLLPATSADVLRAATRHLVPSAVGVLSHCLLTATQAELRRLASVLRSGSSLSKHEAAQQTARALSIAGLSCQAADSLSDLEASPGSASRGPAVCSRDAGTTAACAAGAAPAGSRVGSQASALRGGDAVVALSDAVDAWMSAGPTAALTVALRNVAAAMEVAVARPEERRGPAGNASPLLLSLPLEAASNACLAAAAAVASMAAAPAASSAALQTGLCLLQGEEDGGAWAGPVGDVAWLLKVLLEACALRAQKAKELAVTLLDTIIAPFHPHRALEQADAGAGGGNSSGSEGGDLSHPRWLLPEAALARAVAATPAIGQLMLWRAAAFGRSQTALRLPPSDRDAAAELIDMAIGARDAGDSQGTWMQLSSDEQAQVVDAVVREANVYGGIAACQQAAQEADDEDEHEDGGCGLDGIVDTVERLTDVLWSGRELAMQSQRGKESALGPMEQWTGGIVSLLDGAVTTLQAQVSQCFSDTTLLLRRCLEQASGHRTQARNGEEGISRSGELLGVLRGACQRLKRLRLPSTGRLVAVANVATACAEVRHRLRGHHRSLAQDCFQEALEALEQVVPRLLVQEMAEISPAPARIGSISTASSTHVAVRRVASNSDGPHRSGIPGARAHSPSRGRAAVDRMQSPLWGKTMALAADRAARLTKPFEDAKPACLKPADAATAPNTARLGDSVVPLPLAPVRQAPPAPIAAPTASTRIAAASSEHSLPTLLPATPLPTESDVATALAVHEDWLRARAGVSEVQMLRLGMETARAITQVCLSHGASELGAAARRDVLRQLQSAQEAQSWPLIGARREGEDDAIRLGLVRLHHTLHLMMQCLQAVERVLGGEADGSSEVLHPGDAAALLAVASEAEAAQSRVLEWVAGELRGPGTGSVPLLLPLVLPLFSEAGSHGGTACNAAGAAGAVGCFARTLHAIVASAIGEDRRIVSESVAVLRQLSESSSEPDDADDDWLAACGDSAVGGNSAALAHARRTLRWFSARIGTDGIGPALRFDGSASVESRRGEPAPSEEQVAIEGEESRASLSSSIRWLLHRCTLTRHTRRPRESQGSAHPLPSLAARPGLAMAARSAGLVVWLRRSVAAALALWDQPTLQLACDACARVGISPLPPRVGSMSAGHPRLAALQALQHTPPGAFAKAWLASSSLEDSDAALHACLRSSLPWPPSGLIEQHSVSRLEPPASAGGSQGNLLPVVANAGASPGSRGKTVAVVGRLPETAMAATLAALHASSGACPRAGVLCLGWLGLSPDAAASMLGRRRLQSLASASATSAPPANAAMAELCLAVLDTVAGPDGDPTGPGCTVTDAASRLACTGLLFGIHGSLRSTQPEPVADLTSLFREGDEPLWCLHPASPLAVVAACAGLSAAAALLAATASALGGATTVGAATEARGRVFACGAAAEAARRCVGGASSLTLASAARAPEAARGRACAVNVVKGAFEALAGAIEWTGTGSEHVVAALLEEADAESLTSASVAEAVCALLLATAVVGALGSAEGKEGACTLAACACQLVERGLSSVPQGLRHLLATSAVVTGVAVGLGPASLKAALSQV